MKNLSANWWFFPLGKIRLTCLVTCEQQFRLLYSTGTQLELESGQILFAQNSKLKTFHFCPSLSLYSQDIVKLVFIWENLKVEHQFKIYKPQTLDRYQRERTWEANKGNLGFGFWVSVRFGPKLVQKYFRPWATIFLQPL